jgi:hypothetical protein
VKYFENDSTTALEAMDQANRIAFAPMIFQASRSLKNLGILQAIEEARGKGLTASELEKQTNLSHYGVRVLCEAGLAIGLLYAKEDKYYLTKTAYFFMHDDLTIANTNFSNDVCYEGMFSLDQSIMKGKPEGLKVFGDWATVYEALSELPKGVQDSWFKFDHYYSDISFANAVKVIFESSPRKILDIGGNTGKFLFYCLENNSEVHVSIMDLPGQLNMAKKNASEKGFSERSGFIEANILDSSQAIPKGYDVIWMSQFLDCFSDDEIVSILSRCREAMDENTVVYILEPFWDCQRFQTSAFCLMMTSLYFTAIANGNSQMYRSDVFISLIEKAGLQVEKIVNDIGVSHSLVKCKRK